MGHSIGIQMDLSGIFVTNDVLVDNEQWLKAGDTIIRLNGMRNFSLNEFRKHCRHSKTKVEKIHMHINRKGATVEVMAERDAVKRLLPFLKDRTEGTGTLTYVDPKRELTEPLAIKSLTAR